jgi:hypothetical protein
MYNHRHAVYPRTVSGRRSSTECKGNQCLPKLWPSPQTADSGGALFCTWADTATITTKCQLATSASTRFSTGSRVRQLFRSLCYDGVHQLRTYGTVQRTPFGHRSNSRSATTGDSTGLIWEHRHKYRPNNQARKSQWLIRAELCALSTEYGSQ